MPGAGGQGTVRKVVSLRAAEVVGALKEIHPEHLKSTERRFRFQQEVNALLALDGAGVPRVLDHNTEQWQDKSVSLFIIMQWINGPTLANSRPSTLDDAIASALEITRTVSVFHALGILHRDLKPDNIIYRDGDVRSPVLVDFGMSWSRTAGVSSFDTPGGQELPNRFLRLPESHPGFDHHDARSDISMVVGILFYMLTGLAPRTLQDAQGKLPHERHADRFPSAIRFDPVGPQCKVFSV